MENDVVNQLKNLQLTKEEEESITITKASNPELIEECHHSLFGRLLADRHQNLRALKSTVRAAWKMGSDLRIIEVGNNILQFRFSSMFQLDWVERSGPWNFENNLLLLCRWRKGLTSSNISFSHSPFWVQVWELPFEHMSEEVVTEIGCILGNVLEVDKRSMQADQAKYIRVRINLPIDKPLRRGGFISVEDGERFWVTFKYERLPTFCFLCGKLGHDDKHCGETLKEHQQGKQYGEWLKAGGSIKPGGEYTGTASNRKKERMRSDEPRFKSPSESESLQPWMQTEDERNAGTQSLNDKHTSGEGRCAGMTEPIEQRDLSRWDSTNMMEIERLTDPEVRNKESVTRDDIIRELSNGNQDTQSSVGQANRPKSEKQEGFSPKKNNHEGIDNEAGKVKKLASLF